MRRRLAAFDYFIPYSAKWPGPDDPNFKRAPTLHDFSTMSDLPDTASRRRGSVAGCFTSGCGRITRAGCSPTGTPRFRSATGPRSSPDSLTRIWWW